MRNRANNEKFKWLLQKPAPPEHPDGTMIFAGSLNDEKYPQALALIEEGLDYETLDLDGKSIFALMMIALTDRKQEEQLAMRMMDKGFNPLLMPADDQRLIYRDWGYTTTFETVLGGFEALGDGLRNASGGNLYHSISALAPTQLCHVMDKSNWKGERYHDARQSWIEARDDDGYTPLLRLWDPKTWEDTKTEATKWHPTGNLGFQQEMTHLISRGSYRLFIQGADLLAATPDGIQAWDWMEAHAGANLRQEDVPFFDFVRALTEKQRMTDKTGMAVGRNKPGARL